MLVGRALLSAAYIVCVCVLLHASGQSIRIVGCLGGARVAVQPLTANLNAKRQNFANFLTNDRRRQRCWC